MELKELLVQKQKLDEVLEKCIDSTVNDRPISADIKALNDLYKSIESSYELEELLHKNLVSEEGTDDLLKEFE